MEPSSALSLRDASLLARLVEISLSLSSALEPDAVLRSILKSTAELLDCQTASVLLHNEKRGDLSFMSGSGADTEELADISVPLDGSLAGVIFRTGEPLIVNDVKDDPRHFKQVALRTHVDVQTLIGVPLRRGRQVGGVLEAINKRGGGFTESDAQALGVVASQAAVAIHNARLVQDLQRAHAELSRVDRVKSRFMALASHELRTPLAIIMNYAESLQARDQGSVSAHGTRVLQAALRQRDIIDSLTNMNLLELGAIDMTLVPLSLSQVVRDVCSVARTDALTKMQRLDVTVPNEPVQVNADAARLPLVFKNVLSNAIRFTPARGAIQVTVEATPTEAQVTIRDTGVGIPPGELTNIFKDFYQVDDHMTRRHGGLGLGLAITRGIVQLHAGRIWAESAGVNQGTAIHVVLPRVR
jgi:signal transduction histidine kinase